MQPIRNQILAKPFASEEVSAGGIYVPESARKVSNKMKVVKVGNGVAGKPMFVKEGDVIFRVGDWGTEVLIDGELHFLLDQESVLAKN